MREERGWERGGSQGGRESWSGALEGAASGGKGGDRGAPQGLRTLRNPHPPWVSTLGLEIPVTSRAASTAPNPPPGGQAGEQSGGLEPRRVCPPTATPSASLSRSRGGSAGCREVVSPLGSPSPQPQAPHRPDRPLWTPEASPSRALLRLRPGPGDSQGTGPAPSTAAAPIPTAPDPAFVPTLRPGLRPGGGCSRLPISAPGVAAACRPPQPQAPALRRGLHPAHGLCSHVWAPQAHRYAPLETRAQTCRRRAALGRGPSQTPAGGRLDRVQAPLRAP